MVSNMQLPSWMRRRRPGDNSEPPFDLSKIKWTMSTTNFWAIIVMIAGGIASFYDLKMDNKVRDQVVITNSQKIADTAIKLTTIDMKLTETRELMLKVSGQLDGISMEQKRVSRALDRKQGYQD